MMLLAFLLLFASFKFSFSSQNVYNKTKLLLISFDGFLPSYIDEIRTPTLFSLMTNGSTGRMFPTYPSKTPGNHFSMVTGLYQETHGIFSSYMYDPVLNETFRSKTNDDKWWVNGINMPIWKANELNGGVSGVIMWYGANVPSFLPSYLFPFDSKTSFFLRARVAIKFLKKSNFVCAYFNEPDNTAHAYGPFSNYTLSKVKLADDTVKLIMNQLKKYNMSDIVNLIIVSDHGMAEVTKDREIDLSRLTDLSTYKLTGSSPIWSVWPNPGMEDKVYDHLNNLSKNYSFRVWKRKEIPAEYHFRNHHRIGPMLIEANVGYDIFDVTWIKPSAVWGNHGYNNTDPTMQQTFISYGPCIKRGYFHNETLSNVDLYPLMSYILGFEPFVNNGSQALVESILTC